MVSCLSFFQNRVSAQTFDAEFKSISSVLFTSSSADASVKQIVASYCTAVLWSPAFTQGNFIYNAKYSAFVYLLCSNVKADVSASSFADHTSDFLKRTTFKQLWFTDIDVNGFDFCTPMSDDCDIAKLAPKLFNDLMTDYVNIKQPNLYGMNSNFKTDDELKNQVNIFSSWYFDGLQLCATDKRSYPKTCSTMLSYIKNTRNILSDVRIFNASGILDMTTPAKNDACALWGMDTDLFYCGLYGDQTIPLHSFVNLSYNELFYYRLFTAYYLVMLQKNPGILAKNTFVTDYDTIVKTLSAQYIRSKSALSLTFRMMRDVYTAFPFHIGLLMYQEDLDKFGKTLAGIATPIYTLYDKLRNVQKPQ